MQAYLQRRKKVCDERIKPAAGTAMSSTSREIAAPTSDASSPGTGSSQDVVQIMASSSTAVVAPLPAMQLTIT